MLKRRDKVNGFIKLDHGKLTAKEQQADIKEEKQMDRVALLKDNHDASIEKLEMTIKELDGGWLENQEYWWGWKIKNQWDLKIQQVEHCHVKKMRNEEDTAAN